MSIYDNVFFNTSRAETTPMQQL